ncbi:hypothetical protein GWO43_09715 [candidate division KSB1 bacterium]|nr:hypothetical protein [candidate division KSB1 bacterium]NIT71158.1 hypothetical protein [candidate division KSB1 bacterium]NIX70838.1 hypothetical protein [candidate division KSB1 bacterium]
MKRISILKIFNFHLIIAFERPYQRLDCTQFHYPQVGQADIALKPFAVGTYYIIIIIVAISERARVNLVFPP